MNRRKAVWLAAIALWALLLAPFFFGAQAAHPATDDFTFATYTHPTWLATHSPLHVIKDAVSYALRTWRDWQGTFTGVVVMALNPAVFSLSSYGAHAVLLLTLQLIADFVFLRHMLGTRLRLPRRMWAFLFLCLSATRLIYLPDIVEGIYWFNGAWFYTGAQAVALLTLTLADVWCAAYTADPFAQAGKQDTAQNRRTNPRVLCTVQCVIACGLLFALGMDNYITAMMTAAALFMMTLQRAWAKERRAALRTALLLIPICAGLLLSIVAPGNAVRMAADGAHESGLGYALLSIARTLWAALGYIARFTLRTPLLVLLLLATPFLARALDGTPLRCPPIPATIAGFYLILCAMIVPHMYASGYAGSGRVVNMYHDYVLTAMPIAWITVLSRLKPVTRKRLTDKRGRITLVAAAFSALALCLMGGQHANYAKLVSDQLDGTQAAYIAQFQNEYALCEAAGPDDDVLLPAWSVQTVTGKPTAYDDPTVWTNEAMAGYFGVRSVRSDGAQAEQAE